MACRIDRVVQPHYLQPIKPVSQEDIVAEPLDVELFQINRYPEGLQTLDAAFVQRIQSLVSDVEIELDAVLSAVDE